jgi:ribosomal protein L37AE/L43A
LEQFQNLSSARCGREKKEVVVATISALRGCAHPPVCDRCGETLVAPDYVEYFGEEGLILNLWSCARCGNRFETEALLPAEGAAETAQKGLNTILPTLAA